MMNCKMAVHPKYFILIFAALLFVAGTSLILIGILNNIGYDDELPLLDPFSVTEEKAGESIKAEAVCLLINSEQTENGAVYLAFF